MKFILTLCTIALIFLFYLKYVRPRNTCDSLTYSLFTLATKGSTKRLIQSKERVSKACNQGTEQRTTASRRSHLKRLTSRSGFSAPRYHYYFSVRERAITIRNRPNSLNLAFLKPGPLWELLLHGGRRTISKDIGSCDKNVTRLGVNRWRNKKAFPFLPLKSHLEPATMIFPSEEGMSNRRASSFTPLSIGGSGLILR